MTDPVHTFQDALTARRVAQRFASLRTKVGTINDDATLEQLIDMEIESMGGEGDVSDVSPSVMREVHQKAGRYDFAVEVQLLRWCNKNLDKLNLGKGPLRNAKNEHDVVEIMMELRGGAGYLYFMEAEGHGVGTWDGAWDVLFVDPRSSLKELSRVVENGTRRAYQELKDAIETAAYSVEPDEEPEYA